MAANEIMTTNQTQTEGALYCSIKGGTRAEKAKVYNAMTNPTHKVGDCINQTLAIKDVLVEWIELTEDDGTQVSCPRVVLIDDKGETYQAVSRGIYNAIAKAIAVFGEPTWDEPLRIKVKQVSLGKNQMLTFEVVG